MTHVLEMTRKPILGDPPPRIHLFDVILKEVLLRLGYGCPPPVYLLDTAPVFFKNFDTLNSKGSP